MLVVLCKETDSNIPGISFNRDQTYIHHVGTHYHIQILITSTKLIKQFIINKIGF